MIKIKRVYEPKEKSDGYRVLVDRLWPRGLKKSDLIFDEWLKDLAPSNETRKAFGHDPAKWKSFLTRYRKELRAPDLQPMLEDLARRARRSTVTLLYGAKDETHNQAVVLKQVLDESLR